MAPKYDIKQTIEAIESSSTAVEAAKKLGISRAALYWRLSYHGLKIEIVRDKQLRVKEIE